MSLSLPETPRAVQTHELSSDTRGESSLLAIYVPPETQSVFLHVTESRQGLTSEQPACYIINHLEDAAGHAWIDQLRDKRDYLSFCRTCAIRATVGHAEATLLISKRAYPRFEMGTLFVQVLALDCLTQAPLETPKRLSLQLYTKERALRRPTLPIHLYAPAALWQRMLTSEKLREQWTKELQVATHAFREAGITLQLLETGYLPEGEPDKVVIRKGDWSEARQRFRLHRGKPGIPIFLLSCLQRINPLIPNGDPKEIGGVVGNLPGAPSRRGGMAGILISIGHCDFPRDFFVWDGLGRLITHELGHYLGLPHTTEADGYHDPNTHTGPNDIMHFNYIENARRAFSQKQLKIALDHPSLYDAK